MRHPSEPRFNTDLSVRVFGIGADSRPFSEDSQLKNISDHGAKLHGIVMQLKPGDIIGVKVRGRKARCKVVWAVYLEPADRNEAGVRVLEGELSPWEEEREKQQAIASPIPRTPPTARDERKFARQSIPFPIEIRGCGDVRLHLRTHAADITGNGCYVETIQPLPKGTKLSIGFSLSSELLLTTAIVRTSTGGVGMGIEFTGIDDETQKRLQQHLESMVIGGIARTGKVKLAALKQNA
jgi:PilZ domain